MQGNVSSETMATVAGLCGGHPVHVPAVLVGADVVSRKSAEFSSRDGIRSGSTSADAVNYAVTMLGKSPGRFDRRIDSGNTFRGGGAIPTTAVKPSIETRLIRCHGGSTAFTLQLARPAVMTGLRLSRMAGPTLRQPYLNWILSQRFMPPIAIIVPVVFNVPLSVAEVTPALASSSSTRCINLPNRRAADEVVL